jgi:hypothetical protein
MNINDEKYLRRLLFEGQVEDLANNDAFIEKIAKKMIANHASKKEIEKYVKDIVAACANSFFKALWLKKDFYEREIKNGTI